MFDLSGTTTAIAGQQCLSHGIIQEMGYLCSHNHAGHSERDSVSFDVHIPAQDDESLGSGSPWERISAAYRRIDARQQM